MKQSSEFLSLAHNILNERGEQRDDPDGERSMEMIVSLFNRLYSTNLTTEQGWMFMVILKLVRLTKSRSFDEDSYIDLLGYAALMAEEASRN